MKKTLLTLVGLLALQMLWAQCPPETTIAITTQTQLEALHTQYPECTVLGNVVLGNYTTNAPDPVTNLSPLQNITAVSGLTIYSSCAITSLQGLENLQNIAGDLRLMAVPQLTDVSALAGLQNVEASLYIFNTPISSLIPFNNIAHLGSFEYTEIDGSTAPFDFVFNSESIPGNVQLNLKQDHSLAGLSALNSIGGILNVSGPVTNLQGLHNITSLKSLYLSVTASDLSPLSGITSIAGSLSLGCPNVASLEAFSALTYLGGLTLSQMPLLTNLHGLEGITAINPINGYPGMIYITDMALLSSLNGLHNLTTLNGGSLTFKYSPYLVDISALSGIDVNSISNLDIEYNARLAVCHYATICSYLQGGGTSLIAGNAVGCRTEEQILNQCTSGTQSEIQVTTAVFPVPATDVLYIQSSQPVSNVVLYNLSGQEVFSTSGSHIASVSLSGIANGVYFCRLLTTKGTAALHKVIVSQ